MLQNWQLMDAQSLQLIDREIGDRPCAPAMYEVVRRVIYATGDFEYKTLLHFSPQVLPAAAAAAAARTPIIVDSWTVQAGILPAIQRTFANPVYCSQLSSSVLERDKSHSTQGLEALGRRLPEAIFVLAEVQTSLDTLVSLITASQINPTLIIYTPAHFVETGSRLWLLRSGIPQITTLGRKGNPVVALAIVRTLIELAWQLYGEQTS